MQANPQTLNRGEGGGNEGRGGGVKQANLVALVETGGSVENSISRLLS